MTLKWIRGNFETGAISESNVLPVVDGSDKVTVDINAGDSGVLSMSKRELGSSWMNIVVEGATLFALVDDSKPWNSASAVQFAGWVNKIDGRIGDVVTVQIVGLREYLAARIVSPYGKGGTASPKAGVKFEADTWQGVASAVIQNAFKPVAGAAQPPTVLGDVSGVVSGTSKQRGSRLGDAEKYADILDEIRDSLSPKGLEYRFVPRWKSAAKNAIVWDAVIASDTDGQINWSGEPVPINLSQEQFKHLSFRLSASSEGIANRLIIQSKAGDDETDTGADYTVISVSNGLPLFDTFHNPGQELEQAELVERGTAIIQDLKTPKGSAAYEVADVPENWLPLLGRKLVFTSGNDVDAAGYNITVRCTGMSFTGSDSERSMVAIDVMLPQARYPRLPSSKSKSNGDTMLGGGGGNGSGSSPVTGGHLPGNWSPPAPIEFDDLEPPYIKPGVDENSINKIALTSFSGHAINEDGKLYSWGAKYMATLGTGEHETNSDGNKDESYELNPIQVGEETDWENIYGDYSWVYAIKSDNSLWGWGSGWGLGLGLDDIVWEPQKLMENVAYFHRHNGTSFVVKKDGTLWVAGGNMYGEAGVPWEGTNLDAWDGLPVRTWTQVGIKTDWVKVTSARNAGLVVGLDSAGHLWRWGWDEPNNSYIIDGPIDYANTALSAGNEHLANIRFKDVVACGTNFWGALTDENILYYWGTGEWTLGEGETGGYRLPVPVLFPYQNEGQLDNIHSFLQVGNSENLPYGTMIVVKNDGTLWGFGLYGSGGIRIPTGMIMEIGGDWGEVNFTEPYYCRSVYESIFFILNEGELWGIGSNTYGIMGGGPEYDYRPLAYKVGGDGKDWVRVHTNGESSLAVEDDDMYATGYNGYSQLGLGYIGYEGQRHRRVLNWTIQPSSQPDI